LRRWFISRKTMQGFVPHELSPTAFPGFGSHPFG
jgi:hypothetical protein